MCPNYFAERSSEGATERAESRLAGPRQNGRGAWSRAGLDGTRHCNDMWQKLAGHMGPTPPRPPFPKSEGGENLDPPPGPFAAIVGAD